jgi:hypothetical protein
MVKTTKDKIPFIRQKPGSEYRLPFKLKFKKFEQPMRMEVNQTFNTPFFTEVAGMYIGLGILNLLFDQVEFWSTGSTKTLNFNPFHVIDINHANESADFKTIGNNPD